MVGVDLRLTFAPAYVHRSLGRPGVDAGHGYLQPAELVFAEATYSESGGPCVGTVLEGIIETEHGRYSNLIPLPLAVSGKISAEITFSSGGVLKMACSGVSCIPTGDVDPTFVEPYEG